MTQVFVSGSRKISKLNPQIVERLKNVIEQKFSILVGDANGADKAIQKYLKSIDYANVVVYCSGNTCRNNVGEWSVNHVHVDDKLKGRDFYTQKDLEMANNADYGFVLWDGVSPGSFNNILNLLKKNKKALVYFSPTKEFFNVKTIVDAESLLTKCDKSAYETLKVKVKLPSAIKEISSLAQSSFSF